tara:strand:+ start:1045 stop:1323 length:279 start_codon:yes stop_codon:yes gene_type:complete
MDYNHKKKLNEKINSIKDKDIFFKIFNIIKDELYNDTGQKKYTENYNGIFFDLNKISDKKLYEIEDLLKENSIILTDTDSSVTNKNKNIEII